ncbi:hypothetical protein BKI52_18085 [marine bacterium AO1-C]|nr:hypothetical protein BKI52_18085 [marine bacterium AO1-C]
MLFNSFAFFIFFGVFWLVYRLLPPSYRKYGLLIASYFFYAFWNPAYGLLLIGSTTLDYVCSLQIEKHQTNVHLKKLFLLLSLTVNLGVLIFFKYIDFLGQNIISLAQIIGLEADWVTLNLILPLGISFYTFQTISYTLDVYWGRIQAERNFINLALYVSFFPQLIAGPIERAKYLIPQFEKLRPQFNSEIIFWLTLGFFKKMVVADNLAPFVDRVFNAQLTASSFEYILGAYAFTIQIYADFSGYSDIAVGLALMVGIRLHQNFRQPYFAASFQEFWQRWHISLSNWLRDYLYIPLGGNRSSHRLFTYRNLLITMLLGGLWHGANWTFVVWGGLHGLYLILERPFLHVTIKAFWIRLLKRICVFQGVVLAFVIFRIESLHHFKEIVSLVGSSTLYFQYTSLPSVGLLFAFVSFLIDIAITKQWLLITPKQSSAKQYWTRYIVLLGLFWTILFFGVFQGAQFIYFQF